MNKTEELVKKPGTDQRNIAIYALKNNATYCGKVPLHEGSDKSTFYFDTTTERFEELKRKFTSDKEFKDTLSACKLFNQVKYE